MTIASQSRLTASDMRARAGDEIWVRRSASWPNADRSDPTPKGW